VIRPASKCEYLKRVAKREPQPLEAQPRILPSGPSLWAQDPVAFFRHWQQGEPPIARRQHCFRDVKPMTGSLVVSRPQTNKQVPTFKISPLRRLSRRKHLQTSDKIRLKSGQQSALSAVQTSSSENTKAATPLNTRNGRLVRVTVNTGTICPAICERGSQTTFVLTRLHQICI
jgi:hypothetical protein